LQNYGTVECRKSRLKITGEIYIKKKKTQDKINNFTNCIAHVEIVSLKNVLISLQVKLMCMDNKGNKDWFQTILIMEVRHYYSIGMPNSSIGMPNENTIGAR
jgi:hypothetical protein